MSQFRFPIQYWGSITYFRELCRHQQVCLEIFETYPKQTLRNRARILTGNGILDLSIPVLRPEGSKSLTKDILIDTTQNWQKIHWRALLAAYSSSPYFDHYARDIEALLFQDEKKLVPFQLKLINFILDHLELPVKLALSTAFDKSANLDFLKTLDTRNTEPNYSYQQVFPINGSFVPDLCILDALFNLGPLTRKVISG